MATPMTTVAVPARVPRKGGILSVVPIIDAPRLGTAGGAEWPANLCGKLQDAPALCWSYDTGETVKDEFEAPGWATTLEPFAGYFGAQCFLENYDYAEVARQGLLDAEPFYIEREIQLQNFDAAIAVDLGDVADLIEAIAYAETYADTHYRDLAPIVEVGYSGRPIIWLNRGDAVRAAAAFALFPDLDGNLFTANGTPVVASGEFLRGQVWVSGQAYLFASPITVTPAQDLTLNLEMAIAERIYAIGFDCLEPAFVNVTA